MGRRIAVVHFSPPELYPPVQNFVRLLANEIKQDDTIYLFTTHGTNKKLTDFVVNKKNVYIKRLGISGNGLPAWKRYINYIIHYLGVLFYLIKIRPTKLMYYETISAFAPVIYKKIFNHKVALFIHYHEYTSPVEYSKGPALIRYFLGLEKKIYPITNWVSHTNNDRMRLFQKDIYPIVLREKNIFPNYPPASWQRLPKESMQSPVRVVYAGACSLENMYCEQFAEWVILQQGRVVWDIYAYNISQEAVDYFKSKNISWINIKPGVDYDDLPQILQSYDVGVILYKGHIPNYIYNAPNKLFEYLACGLDVWYADKIVGCGPYASDESCPKVMGLDFENMESYTLDVLTQYVKCNKAINLYTAENSAELLLQKLMA